MTEIGGLEVVFLANRPALLRYLTTRLRDAALAEDAAQDLWIKLQRLDCGPILHPLSYLYRMAENIALDRRRSVVRRENRDHAWAESQLEGTVDSPADGAPSAERILIGRDEMRRIDAALDQLPERTAHIFRAVRFDHVPQKDLAAKLGISLRAVEKQLQRALRHILDLRHPPDTEKPRQQRHDQEGTEYAE
jgi:RNA polymerase sigma factor (sigma-70 family)